MNYIKSLKKVVKFNMDSNITYDTYDGDEYDRSQIDSILYLKAYNKVSIEEWNNVHVTLDLYKLYEMPIHKDSLHNNQYQARKVIIQNNKGTIYG